MTTGSSSRPIAHERALELAATGLDFPLSPGHRAALAAHLAWCVPCARTADELRRDAQAIVRVSSIGRPSTRPLETLRAASRRPARPARRGRSRLTLLAAAAVLAAGVGTGAVLGGALQAIRPPIGFEPPDLVWTRVADAAALQAAGPASRVEAVAAFPFAATPLVAAGVRGGDAAIWMTLDEHAWTRVTDPDLRRGRIEAVAASGRRMVAVGSSVERGGSPVGRIWQTRNATTWDASTIPGVRSLTAVAASPGTVVVAGIPRSASDAPLWISSDEGPWRSWDPGTIGRATITALAAGGPGFVAVGYDDRGGVAWASPDGRDWTRTSSSGFARSRVAAVAATPAGLVAVGWTTDASEQTTPVAWISTDGYAWTRVEVDPGARGARLQGVTATPYGIIVVGASADGAAAWISDDGRDWARTGLAAGTDASEFGAVGVYGEHVIVAGGDRAGPALWQGTTP